MGRWQPKDFIALAVVIGAVSLLHRDINSFVGFTLIGIVCAYYGIDLTPWFKVGRNQGKKEGDK